MKKQADYIKRIEIKRLPHTTLYEVLQRCSPVLSHASFASPLRFTLLHVLRGVTFSPFFCV